VIGLPVSASEIHYLSLGPRFERNPDGTRTLSVTWSYLDTEGWIVVASGFVTDFSSVPHRLSWLMPPWSQIDLAGLAHDAAYREEPYHDLRRARADRVWARIALAQGVSRYSAWKGYRALRLFGWRSYGARNPHVKARGA